jgi:FKBP-type peptidyl-prolyl cis-trans isomerase SlyD
MPRTPNIVVEAHKVVRLAVSLRDDQGETLPTDNSSLEVLTGFGHLLPHVEQSILGLAVGEKCVLELKPNEAFGEHDEGKIVEFDRDDFPEDVAQEDIFDAEGDNGAFTPLLVLEVHDEYVLVDMNHPLAGKRVTVEFEVLEIRSAGKEDLQAATIARQNNGSSSKDSLLPLNRLLGGRPQR